MSVTVPSAQCDWFADVKPGSLRGVGAGAVAVSGGPAGSTSTGRVWVSADSFSMATAAEHRRTADGGGDRSGGSKARGLVSGSVIASGAAVSAGERAGAEPFNTVAPAATGHARCVEAGTAAVLPASAGFAVCTLDRDGAFTSGSGEHGQLPPSRVLCVRPPPMSTASTDDAASGVEAACSAAGRWSCFVAPCRTGRAAEDKVRELNTCAVPCAAPYAVRCSVVHHGRLLLTAACVRRVAGVRRRCVRTCHLLRR